MHVVPLPETVEALRELSEDGDRSVATMLFDLSDEAERLVPGLVGLSLLLVEEHLTFTMCATTEGGDPLDVLRRADERPVPEPGEVASSLSFPVLDGARTRVAEITFYSAGAHDLEGRQTELARACGAPATAARADADLEFRTRTEAGTAPRRIREERAVDQAVGALMSVLGIDDAEAERRLAVAASAAGTTVPELARTVLRLVAVLDD